MKSNTYLLDENNFLRCVTSIANMPDKVYANGFIPDSRVPTVAIIGTRRPTLYGTKVAFDFAEALAKAGVVIVSGLAYGIDSAAHKGALAGKGTTIAVMAHGLDTIYPSGNTQLAHDIVAQGGALISSYPEGTPVHKYRFLERNQWVSGLADAVVVIEAEERSGTKATVRYALDQGKDVFAVPGPITSSRSNGPNKLIQDGAHIALSAQDILARIAPHLIATSKLPIMIDPDRKRIYAELCDAPSTTNQLLHSTGLDYGALVTALTFLEVDGLVDNRAGVWHVRTDRH